MDDPDEEAPFERPHGGLEHGYTPPDQRRRKPLPRKDELGPSFNEMLYIQVGLGIVVLLLLAWFIFHIIQEKRKNEAAGREVAALVPPLNLITAVESLRMPDHEDENGLIEPCLMPNRQPHTERQRPG